MRRHPIFSTPREIRYCVRKPERHLILFYQKSSFCIPLRLQTKHVFIFTIISTNNHLKVSKGGALYDSEELGDNSRHYPMCIQKAIKSWES